MTPGITKEGYLEPVGHFPFDTRKQKPKTDIAGSIVCPATRQILFTVGNERVDKRARHCLEVPVNHEALI